MTIKVTENETKVLRALETNFFHDGAEPIGNPIWADSINDADEPSGIDGHALSAVVSSLSKKGLIVTDGTVIMLTGAHKS